ncbi:hypothetical protein DPV78_007988 [Talaromyces pinophilus]|nr:hypothetical protein DPV78_007988 [Talaromyces pinophilus]
MCHADTSALAVFKWDKNPKPILNTKRVPHKCVDWDENTKLASGSYCETRRGDKLNKSEFDPYIGNKRDCVRP